MRSAQRTAELNPTHIKDLVPDPANRRQHNPRNIGMVVDAMHRVGAGRSIVIDEDNVVLAGNGVLEAAAEAGITKVRVVEVDGSELVAVRRSGLSADDKRALAIYDNRAGELAEWNPEQLQADVAAGLDLKPWFSEEELAKVLGQPAPKDGLTDPDAVPAVRATDIRLGDLFELGGHLLLCGDSTKADDVRRVMNGQQAGCVFADPPYGMSLDTRYDSMHSGKGHRNTGDRFNPVIGDDKPFDPRPPMSLWQDAGEQFWFGADYYRQYLPAGGSWVVWDKRDNDSGMNLDDVHGSSFELCWSRQSHRREIARVLWSGHHGMIGSDKGTRVHPTQKPVALVVWFSQRFDLTTVADPFLGSGTTLLAAEQIGAKGFGIEIDAAYCQVAIDRWEAFTGQQATKVGEAVLA